MKESFSKEKMTRFEKTRIIGARSLQISLGAPVLIKTKKTDPIEVSKEEFEKDVLPITVRRRQPKRFDE